MERICSVTMRAAPLAPIRSRRKVHANTVFSHHITRTQFTLCDYTDRLVITSKNPSFIVLPVATCAAMGKLSGRVILFSRVYPCPAHLKLDLELKID